jgi:uncharacterized protein with NRDE domain
VCTLILAWRTFDGTPIAAAANRDEALARPSRPPGVLGSGATEDPSERASADPSERASADPVVVAPQDEQAGGTWIGYNDAGLFVGVTNRQADIEGERSRGLLVRDALSRPSASEAVTFVESELAEREYAGFNLVVADAAEAVLLEWDGVLRTTRFDPGVHVVVNEGHDGKAEKARRVQRLARPDPDDDASAWFERAEAVLRDHDREVCIHGEDYGTRSSSLVRLDGDGTAAYWFADGKPCETDYKAVEADDAEAEIGGEETATGDGEAATSGEDGQF